MMAAKSCAGAPRSSAGRPTQMFWHRSAGRRFCPPAVHWGQRTVHACFLKSLTSRPRLECTAAVSPSLTQPMAVWRLVKLGLPV